MRGSVLISGAGIAGPALAYWLLHHGFTVTIVESSKERRQEGFIIDFWGAGYDVAEKMGLLPAVHETSYDVREVRLVNARGRKVGGFDAPLFRRATRGRYTSLLRGDLARVLLESVEERTEMVFDDSITALEERSNGVLVRFERAAARRFDLVIGADGLHSRVRELAFGPESRFDRFLGYSVAAFAVRGYQPRDEGVYVSYGFPRRQIARFAMRDDRTMFLLVSADDPGSIAAAADRDTQRTYLKSRFAHVGWESAQIVGLLDSVEKPYFDRVSQIRMQCWSTSHIALVGDAAYCPSLLAGEGASLAILGAYVLAGELAANDSPTIAFARYRDKLHHLMNRKQKAAERFAGTFAPKTPLGLFLRNELSRALTIPILADLAMRQTLRDDFDLPSYEDARLGQSWVARHSAR
jgi:2-polyprenyl-6-methoxyphenol hydroxylase-like FAD-dependent oxidoreductase